jgi:hypothetical protein
MGECRRKKKQVGVNHGQEGIGRGHRRRKDGTAQHAEHEPGEARNTEVAETSRLSIVVVGIV